MTTLYQDNYSQTYDDSEEEIPEFLKPEVTHIKPTRELSPHAQTFLEHFLHVQQRRRPTVEPKIRVSDVFSGLALFYEKLRNAFQYKNEYVIRRAAIERILKRLMKRNMSDSKKYTSGKVAESLIKELIWAKYFRNNDIVESRQEEITKTIAKYHLLMETLSTAQNPPTRSQQNWIWEIAATEIEEILDPSDKDLYVELMCQWFRMHFDWTDVDIPQEEKDLQIYIAAHKALHKSDESMIRYYLLKKYFPNWDNDNEEDINIFIQQFLTIYDHIEKHLLFEKRNVLYRKIQRYAAAFDMFAFLAKEEKEELEELVHDEEKLKTRIEEICLREYRNARSKVNKGTLKSIIYIFVTKVFILVLVELPYEMLILGGLHYGPLSMNLTIPPILMWIITLPISTPGNKNTESITNRITSLLYQKETNKRFAFSVYEKKRSILFLVFGILYSILFVALFAGVSYLLLLASFSIVGIFVFFIFMSLVLLFAFRLRFSVSQLRVESEQETILGHLFHYITLPLLNFGFLISKVFHKVNFFPYLLDHFIEPPLKKIIKGLEAWASFIREKKEEVVEVPD